MINSKPLKDYKPRSGIKQFFRDLIWPIVRFCKRIKKYYEWCKILKDDYDWDGHYIYHILGYKLQRTLKVLENGHAIHEPKDLEALSECIILCDKLYQDNYENPYHEIHNDKWGELEVEWVPCKEEEDNKKGLKQFKSSRKNAKTKSQKEMEKKEFLQCFLDGKKDMASDRTRLFRLIKKHINKWWD